MKGTLKCFGVERIPNNDMEIVPTPVGELCGHCGEVIAAGDWGYTYPGVGQRGHPYHAECQIRLVVGSLAHQMRRCSCYGGTEEDPPGMTLHDAARAAYTYCMLMLTVNRRYDMAARQQLQEESHAKPN